MDNKCYGCKDRHYNCHSECEDYKAFRVKLDEINAKNHRESQNVIALKSCAEHRYQRRLRKQV